MASNTRNVKLGVCRVIFGGNDLGYTKGGVEVEVSTDTHKVDVDQFGKSPINEYIMGREVSAKVPLAETTLFNLVAIMPGATLVQTGGVAATGTIIFADVGDAEDTVTVNGKVFTAKVSAALPSEFTIGGTAAATAANLLAKLQASLDLGVVQANYTLASATITATYIEKGTAGNAFTLAVGQVGDISVGAATLTSGTNPTASKVDVTTGVGVSLLDLAQKLVLHPTVNAADNQSEDFVIPLANTAGALQFAYKIDDERIYNVTFMGYPDSVTGKLFTVGDEAAV